MSMDANNPNPDLHIQISTMSDFSVRFSITLECPTPNNQQHSDVSPSSANMQLISPSSMTTTPSANTYQTMSNSTHSGLKTGKMVEFEMGFSILMVVLGFFSFLKILEVYSADISRPLLFSVHSSELKD